MGKRARFGQFSTIAGLSQRRRLPRIAKLHLGIKAHSKAKNVQYPKEVDYFVLHEPDAKAASAEREFYEKFHDVYGDTPRTLDIIIPCDDIATFFPQAYRMYGSGVGLKCIGDGVNANRVGALLESREIGDAEVGEVECQGEECPFYKTRVWVCGNLSCEMKGQILDPGQKQIVGKNVDGRRLGFCAKCEKIAASAGGCKWIGSLQFVLPRVNLFGTVQIDTSSYHAIVNLNSALAEDGWVRNVFGHVDWLYDKSTFEPVLKLVRPAKETHGSGRKEIHWPMAIMSSIDLEGLTRIRDQVRLIEGKRVEIDAVDAGEKPRDLYPAEAEVTKPARGLPAPKPEEEVPPGDELPVEEGEFEVAGESPEGPAEQEGRLF